MNGLRQKCEACADTLINRPHCRKRALSKRWLGIRPKDAPQESQKWIGQLLCYWHRHNRRCCECARARQYITNLLRNGRLSNNVVPNLIADRDASVDGRPAFVTSQLFIAP